MSTVEPPAATGVAEAPKVRTRLERFLSRPAAIATAWVLTVVSVPLSIYLYFRPPEHRDLCYMVHPDKTVIVKEGQLSRLNVMLDGKPVASDVSAAQVAIWNAGNQAIRSEHVLESLRLLTSPSVPIIEATVGKTSRGVVHFALDRSNLQRGELGVSWNILEGDDGATIQVVFAGSTDTNVVATAVLEGQPVVRRIVARTSPPGKYDSADHTLGIIIVVWSFMIGQLLVFWLLAKLAKGRLEREWFAISLAAGIVGTAVVLALREHRPPFGF